MILKKALLLAAFSYIFDIGRGTISRPFLMGQGMSHYHGTLIEMFEDGMREAQKGIHSALWDQGMMHSFWQEYRGPDCAPFNIYTRFSKNQIILSSINGVLAVGEEGVPVRKGRMPLIIAAAFEVAPKIIVESVVNQHLERYLHYNDFVPMKHDSYSFVKERE